MGIFRFLFAVQVGFLVSFFSLSSNDIQKLGEITKNPDLPKAMINIQKTGLEYISNLGSELDKINPVIKKHLNCLLTEVTKNPISSQVLAYPYASQVVAGILGFFFTYIITSIFCCLFHCLCCSSKRKKKKEKKEKKRLSNQKKKKSKKKKSKKKKSKKKKKN